MSCPDEEKLRALAHGELPAADGWVTGHVASCEACAATVLRLAPASADEAPTRSVLPESLAPPPPRRASGGTATPRTIGGRYVILSELGEGGMGTVYAAHDTELGRQVALKLVKGEGDSAEAQADGQARLLREAQAMAQLSHPNVLQVFDAGHHEGGVFLSMELVKGKDVKVWLKEQPRGWRETLDVFLKAGEGLAAAHDAGLIHRDFKPPNVLLGDDGRVRVADFGIARATGAQPDVARAASSGSGSGSDSGSGDPLPGSERLATPLTAVGHLVGTMGYVAPELLAGQSAEEGSDQFSFCVSLYEALYGARPFPGRGMVEYHAALKRGLPGAPPKGARVPRWLFEVLLKGLSLNPADRYPTLRALLTALRSDPAIRRRRVLTVGAAFALACGLVGATLLLTRHPVRDCAAEGRALDDTWGEAPRAAMRAAFGRLPQPRGLETFARVEKRLDVYAEQWVKLATDTCLQDQAAAGAVDPLRVLRVVCLEERRTELGALTSLFSNADGVIADHAVEASQRLTQPRRCLNEGVLRRAALASPGDPAMRARAQALRRDLLRAQVLYDSGQQGQSGELLSNVVAQARTLGLAPELSEGLLLSARIASFQAKTAEAMAQLAEALHTAETRGADELIVNAAARLSWVEALGGRSTEARRDLETARAALRRLDDVDVLVARVARSEAALEATQGNVDKAIELERSAIDLFTRGLGSTHPETLSAVTSVAVYFTDLGKVRESAEQFEALVNFRRETLGPDTSELCLVLNNLGYSLTLLGEWARAKAAIDEAISCAEKTVGPRSPLLGDYLSTRAQLQTRSKDPGALQTANLAVSLLPEDNEDLAAALLERGRAATAAGRPAEALADCQHVASFAKQHDLIDNFWEDALTCEGLAMLALHRTKEALAPLQEALVHFEAPNHFAGARQEVRFALARALWDSKGDRKRAVTLATQARDDLDALPGRAAEQQAIIAWLATHHVR